MMAVSHHSFQYRASVGVQTDAVPTPVDEFVAPAAAPCRDRFSHYSDRRRGTRTCRHLCSTSSNDRVCGTAIPETVNTYVAPAPVVEYIGPPPAVSYPSFGLVNPQISITADETSQVQVVVREIPDIPVVEWIQEQSAVPDLVNPQISTTFC